MLSWNVLGDVWSSYSVENQLVPASEERNSTMDATLGTLETRKAAVCRSVNFWWETPSRGYHLEIFCKFQSTFEKFGWEFVFSSVTNWIL